MNWHNNPFAQLADRVRRGDDSAAEQLRRQMTPCVERMVRRVANYGACPSAWEQKIQSETEHVLSGNSGRWERDSDHVIGQVADRLCHELVEQLRQQWQADETVTAASDHSRPACIPA